MVLDERTQTKGASLFVPEPIIIITVVVMGIMIAASICPSLVFVSVASVGT